ncbi:MAG: FtsX-like permease family protein [Gemmataceae bacterium]
MSVWRLIFQEILYRKINFGLGVLSVIVAVGCLVAQLALLDQHDLRTEQVLSNKEAEIQQRLRLAQADTRRAVEELQKQTDADLRFQQAQLDLRLQQLNQKTAEDLTALEQNTAGKLQQLDQDSALQLQAIEQITAERMKKLEDDFRKITKNLGFNVLILHKDQKLDELHARDYPSHYMPEKYVDVLAKSDIVTINHLLPLLQEKLKWPEHADKEIILAGTRGEVPILHRDPKKPILDPVPPGAIVVGHALHSSLHLVAGDIVKLLGREFKIHKLHAQRGNKDDITVWINLGDAQELLNRQGQINALLALECTCAEERLPEIRKEITTLLPDTQVIEFASQALARAEARRRVALEAQEAIELAKKQADAKRQLIENYAKEQSELITTHKLKKQESLNEHIRQEQAAIERNKEQRLAQILAAGEARQRDMAELSQEVVSREKAHRAEMREEKESYAAFLVPLVLVGCIVWIGVLTFTNVRERAVEIGILRALGLSSRKVFTLFLGKAVLMGLCGAMIGYAAGLVLVAWTGDTAAPVADVPRLFQVELLLGVIVAAPLLGALASWMPALLAVWQDPANVLREA